MSPGVVALAVGGIGAAAVLGNAVRHSIPLGRFVKYAALAFVGGFLVTALTYRFVPVLWLVIAAGPAVAAWWLSERFGARNYRRSGLTLLLIARLKDVIPDWTGRSIRLDWNDGCAAAAIEEIKIGLPAKVLPARVTPNIKTVLSETLSGQWSVAVKGTVLTCRRAEVTSDPAAVRHLKEVLSDPNCFGADFQLKAPVLTPAGDAIERYAVSYGKGNTFVTPQKRASVERILRQRIPVPSGSWMFQWDLPQAEMSAIRSAFEPIMYAPPIKHFVTSREEAAERYAESKFVLGVYGDGTEVLWTPDAEGTPHCNTCGASGKGKTSWAHNLLQQTAAAGWCNIVADFKLSKSYRGFLDWPNMHVVTNGIYSNIKTIYYVVEILNRRRQDNAGHNGISNDVPILFLMDEYAEFAMQMVKNIWPRFKVKDSPSQPPVLGEIDQLIIMAREFRIHIVTMLQKPSADFINTNIIFNSGKKIQVGKMPGAMSNVYWGNYDIGESIPDLKGRGLVTDFADGVPAREFQAYYTPDPLKARTPSDFDTLANLLPPTSLYPRVVFDMPNPHDITVWNEIVTAPWELADERPDLDPLSPHFRPQPIFTYDTLKNMDPASMSVQ
ncbi:MAG: hypothetical protein AB7G47_19360 [Mycolicibacterium sp.]|uniref:hypothetical protein n=1 Tax=Mycolicibacterium sp. TaxID=2320850 RepID=UPI003D0C9C89